MTLHHQKNMPLAAMANIGGGMAGNMGMGNMMGNMGGMADMMGMGGGISGSMTLGGGNMGMGGGNMGMGGGNMGMEGGNPGMDGGNMGMGGGMSGNPGMDMDWPKSLPKPRFDSSRDRSSRTDPYEEYRDTRDDDRYRDRDRDRERERNRESYSNYKNRERRRAEDRERPRDRDDRDRRSSREHDRDRRDRDRYRKDRDARPPATRIELPKEIQYPQTKVDPQQEPLTRKQPTADPATLGRRKSRFEGAGTGAGAGPVPAPAPAPPPPAAQTDLNPDGSENLALKYKDEGLNLWVRRGEEEKPMFTEELVDGVLTFTCSVCGAKLFGVKNVAIHYNGKKHKNRLAEEGWTSFDPVKEPPRKTGPTSSEECREGAGAEKQEEKLESEMAAFEKELQTPAAFEKELQTTAAFEKELQTTEEITID